MQNTTREIRLFPEVVARRREQYGGLTYLSDWQVHSAHITAGSISFLAGGLEKGPIYIPMPTGSGKTTGAIWGIIDFVEKYPEQRLCFLTPYQESVDRIYAELARHLGEEVVGHYHGLSFTDKSKALEKQVVVLTHQFIASNPERLDDRDVFVVDEAIYATGEASLKLDHIFAARSWATRNNILVNEFIKLADFAVELDRQLRNSTFKYVAAPPLEDTSWAEQIANGLDLPAYSQRIDNMEVMIAVQRFCEALLKGLVFLSKGQQDSKRYDPVFSAAVLGIPRMDKTVILSATGGMVYDIAGPFQEYIGSREYWTPPSYQNLELIQLSSPAFSGHYSTWGRYKDELVAYIDWLLSEIDEPLVYLTLPKKVLDICLRDYLGAAVKGEIEYPLVVNKYGKTVYVSNHARSVGSNEFKNCSAVVYLWEDYKPQSVSVQRFHTLANEPVTNEALQDAQYKLVGNYQRIRDAQIIDTMMQQIGRGKVRHIDEQAIASSMKAYVLCAPQYFERLAAQYPDCTTSKLEYPDTQVDKPSSRVAQILQYLRQRHPKEDVPFTEIEDALGFSMRKYAAPLSSDWDLMMLGYEYVSGQRGRGKSGYFRRTTKS